MGYLIYTSAETWSKGLALPFAFALLLIFIQEGYSYYASVQTVALLFLAGLVAWA